MDPNSGRLYDSVEEAIANGVEFPVLITGREDDIMRVSNAVNREQRRREKRKRRLNNDRSRKIYHD